jgi:ATP-dependent DNA helicase RecG
MPPGRKPVKTYWFPENKADRAYEMMTREMDENNQVYVVYPLVKESEKIDLKDAETMYRDFKDRLFKNYRVGIIHGRMKREEKEKIMEQFHSHQLDLLVSTTVIEVGVDVAGASLMVIEHAERFGLAQLHQLRGRIGRGTAQSYCILITGYKLSREGRERMKAMVKHHDGFKLAEIDLELRGPGEMTGTRQTGLPDLAPADMIHDRAILEKAREEAFSLIARDPDLKEHQKLSEYMKNESFREMNLIRVS